MVFYGDELVLQFIFAPEDTTERDYEIGGYDSSVVRVSEDGVVHIQYDLIEFIPLDVLTREI